LNLLDGLRCAATIRSELKARVESFRAAHGRPPGLSIVLVGDDPASHIYVRNKERAGAETGLAVTVRRLPATVSLDSIVGEVGALNADDSCDGILVQSPLPSALGRHAAQQVFDALDPQKDVDGFHPHNVGLLVQGRARLAACTPTGIIELLEREKVTMAGARAVVIGRSEIVGKPAALMLLQRDATVTVCHSRTKNLPAVAREADILVAAIGRAGFVTRDFVRPGAVVVDVGINRVDDRNTAESLFGPGHPRLADFDKKGSLVVGDVHPDVATVAGGLTPVPGGIGPMTIAMLLRNTLIAAEDRLSRERT
jgi:methylenetetrahydrofolate dehydrogenase (NADP+)/methenyltetrahydrofolate cyclohydrolase